MSSTALRSFTKRSFYPLFLDISNKLCIVLGGGKIAERKVTMLLKFNATVRLISPKITANLSKLSKSGRISVLERDYRNGDLNGATLIFAATNRKMINNKIKKEAEARGIPVNVVDDPGLCDFIVPSIVQKAPITIAISTSGSLPSLSKKLRKEISKCMTKEYIKYGRIMAEFREHLIKTVEDKKLRKKIMSRIDKTELKELIGMNMEMLKNNFLRVIK